MKRTFQRLLCVILSFLLLTGMAATASAASARGRSSVQPAAWAWPPPPKPAAMPLTVSGATERRLTLVRPPSSRSRAAKRSPFSR